MSTIDAAPRSRVLPARLGTPGGAARQLRGKPQEDRPRRCHRNTHRPAPVKPGRGLVAGLRVRRTAARTSPRICASSAISGGNSLRQMRSPPMTAPGSTRISRAVTSTFPTTRPEMTTAPPARAGRHRSGRPSPRPRRQSTCGHRWRCRAHGRAAGDRRLVGDEARDLDVAASGPEVVADTAVQVDPAAGQDHITLDVARDLGAAGGQGGRASDGALDLTSPAAA